MSEQPKTDVIAEIDAKFMQGFKCSNGVGIFTMKQAYDDMLLYARQLEKEVYVSGCFRCPKCDYQLTKKVMLAATGEVGFNASCLTHNEPCPNDGETMVRVTWKEAAADYDKSCWRFINERDAATQHIAELERERDEGEKEHLETIASRDFFEDYVQRIHVALGGDGEFTSSRNLGEECFEMIEQLQSQRDSLQRMMNSAVKAKIVRHPKSSMDAWSPFEVETGDTASVFALERLENKPVLILPVEVKKEGE